MPFQGYRFWGSITTPDDYGGSIANASISIMNYVAVLLAFFLAQIVFFLIVKVQNR
jgi:hypothetical protein